MLHTVCGSFETPQLGHSECALGMSLMLADLRERVEDRLVLRFGTAIAALLSDHSSSDRKAAQRGSISWVTHSQRVTFRFTPQVAQSPAQS